MFQPLLLLATFLWIWIDLGEIQSAFAITVALFLLIALLRGIGGLIEGLSLSRLILLLLGIGLFFGDDD